MARPKKAPDELRSARFPAPRVTEAEFAFIEGNAAKAGLTLADYVRRRLLGHHIPAARQAADDALLIELNRVGVNLNQIARALNSDREPPHDLADVLADLKTALAKVAADGS